MITYHSTIARRGAAIGAVLAATAALTGCGGDTESAPAAPKTTTNVAVSVHPCDVFSEVMAVDGYFDPGHNDRTTPRTELGCQYSHNSPGYVASIYTVGRPYAEMVDDDRLVEREHLIIDGHDVSIADGSAVGMCIISLDIPPGTLQIDVGFSPPNQFTQPDSLTTIDQACTEGRKVLDIIAPVLPDHT
jgi:Protein of unknown function (DUF3558)